MKYLNKFRVFLGHVLLGAIILGMCLFSLVMLWSITLQFSLYLLPLFMFPHNIIAASAVVLVLSYAIGWYLCRPYGCGHHYND